MAPVDDPFKLINVGQHIHVGIGAIAEGIQARKDSRHQRPTVGEQANSLGKLEANTSTDVVTGKLDLPVILPQRRPKERSRGFLRAYAPLLVNVGIDQRMWLNFLDDFEQSTRATGWIRAINLASLAGQAVPEPFSILVSMAVKETIRIAQEIDSRQKTNTFLNKVNAEFFRPRGVVCMVMTWRPDTSEIHPTVDLNAAAHESESTGSSSFKDRFKSSSGTSYGGLEIPAAAPLVFPSDAPQQLVSRDDRELGLKQKFKQTKAFVDDYIDRRAQAAYATENPDNLLATQVPTKFRTKYSDPNHPANIDPLGSFLTGGYTDQAHLDAKAQAEEAQAQAQKLAADARAQAEAAQAQAQRDIAKAQAQAGYVPTLELPTSPVSQPYASTPGPLVAGAVPRLVAPVPLDPLSQRLVEGLQRLVDAQQRYIGAGTKAVQDVVRTNVIYLMVVSLPSEEE